MDDFTSEVATIRALLHLDLMEPRAVITWAEESERRTDGLDGLVTLAYQLPDVRREEVIVQLASVAHELGLEPLTERMAGLIAAEDVARRLERGEVTPIEAARRIWRITRIAPAAEPLLRPFVGFASEWEDDPEHRSYYEVEICSAAQRLATRDPRR